MIKTVRLFSAEDAPALIADLRRPQHDRETLLMLAAFYAGYPAITFFVDGSPIAAIGYVPVQGENQVWAYITHAAAGHGLWIVRTVCSFRIKPSATPDAEDIEAVRFHQLFLKD